jgi:hypothetical protein
VNREPFKSEPDEPVRRSPGHHRRVPLETFMQYSPDYLDAEFVPRGAPDAGWPRWLLPEAEFGPLARPAWLGVDGIEGAPPGHVLRLIENAGAGG